MDYAYRMNATSLPARIGYAIGALAIGGGAGFYLGMWLLPKLAIHLHGSDAEVDGYGIFKNALWLGAGMAFTGALAALTLPWKRHRRRSGRAGRIVVSCLFVVPASLCFAGLGHAAMYDLAFAAWLAYVTAFTFVRYGVLDGARRRSSSAGESSYRYPGE